MRRIIIAAIGAILICIPLLAQDEGVLIIDPKLKGGLGLLPHIRSSNRLPGNILNVNEIPPGWKPQDTTRVNFRDIVPQDAPPDALLITGKVPDPSRRYVVAVTKDEAEFQRVFPEYKRLVAEGNHMEAGQVLRICTSIAVTTRVEGFVGGEKTGDVPRKIGTFRFEFGLLDFQDRGGCLTFLSYEPKPGDDVADFGYGLSDTIHGVLMIEQLQAAEGEKPQYSMRIIKAKMTR